MDSVHHIWCPLSSQEFQNLPDGAETTLTAVPYCFKRIFACPPGQKRRRKLCFPLRRADV
ncbi:hypothetical protein EE387_23650 [Salmonella enterica]|nr:hypothetical protein [Salmonella enterica]